MTLTYLGLKTDDTAAVRFGVVPSDNLFVAGNMMAGNILGQGYTAGVGMSIGSRLGRIAGSEAARAATRKPRSPASAFKLRRHPMLGDAAQARMDYGLLALLFLSSATGLALWLARCSSAQANADP